jgi:hypothetical protein
MALFHTPLTLNGRNRKGSQIEFENHDNVTLLKSAKVKSHARHISYAIR